MAKRLVGFNQRTKRTPSPTATHRKNMAALRRSEKLMYNMLSPEQKKAYRKKQRELKNSGCMLYLIIATTATLSLIFSII